MTLAKSSKGAGSPTRHAYLARIQNRANYLPIDLSRIAAALHKALEMAEGLLDDDDKGIKLKAAHALSQTSAALLRVLEVGEMEARLAEVELAELARQDREARTVEG
ncbi:hypothetical protein [Deinococcus kurensis]|uniref:hypothetical protein n=1 Tax=Deinococcus kurensis TaxID=2662757 RepID=UPI0012D2CF2E|nr:hypothetical protein [Deinococcus kurensis]